VLLPAGHRLAAGAQAATRTADVKLVGVALTPYFLTDDAMRLWRLQVSQIAADPSSARWVARAVVAEPQGVVVGHAGFHGPPVETGMVEVAYSVDPRVPAPRLRQGDAPRATAPRRRQTHYGG
jgi:hypothetical protein